MTQPERVCCLCPLRSPGCSCPALFKAWLDRALSRGFASGVGGTRWKELTLRGHYRRNERRIPA
ncbi:hypothetical protein JZ788_15105 [Enterobacteriaceae bacterium YMB-R21]|nr:hypothetical protein [Tenebrionicola larvae]